MKLRIIALLFSILVIILGCSEKPYIQPQPAAQNDAVASPQSPPTAKQQEPVVKTFNLGETSTDGKLKFTLNTVSYVDSISNEYGNVVVPQEGHTFAVLDVTVENLQPDKTETIAILLQMKVLDSEGYTYGAHVIGTVMMDRVFNGNNLLPGSKTRGNVVFDVPLEQKLKFHFLFDIAGQTTVYELN